MAPGTNLLIIWPHSGREQRSVIELKILRGSRERTIAEGLPQTVDYMDRCGAQEGHLVIFDRNPARSWEERIFQETMGSGGRTVRVWGM